MTAMSNAEFARHMLDASADANPFEPGAVYDRDGDCIEFLAKPDPFYAERIDELVTVYYSQDTQEVVGSLIKGVRAFLRKHPGLSIEIRDGRMRIVHLFRASFWNKGSPQAIETRTYTKLIEVAEVGDVTAELVPA